MKTIRLSDNSWFTREPRQLLGIDLRSLALLRVGLAFVVIVDLFQRSLDLKAHYSDLGVLPRWALTHEVADKWNFSIHNLNGTSEFEAILFIAHGIIAFLLLVGFKTRLVTVLCWILTISLQSRNPLILSGGDDLLVLFLLWSTFLPMGARFSVDSALDQGQDNSSNYCSPATLAIMLQLSFMYWFTWMILSHPIWTGEHSALYYALNLDLFSTRMGTSLSNFHSLTSLLTSISYWFGLIGPILVFSPIATRYVRMVVLVAFIGFHIGIALALNNGYLPAVAIVACSIFIPGVIWDKLAAYLSKRPAAHFHIYFDEDCDFCKKTVLLLKTFFLWNNASILPAQSNQHIESIFRANNSWVVIDHTGTEQTGFKALIYGLQQTPFVGIAASIFKIPPVPSVGQLAYKYVANHRNIFSKLTTHLRYRHQSLQIPNWAHGLSLLILLYLSVSNIAGIRSIEFEIPRQIDWVGTFFGVQQHWHMFDPDPFLHDVWYVIPGRLKNEREIDIYNDDPIVRWEKPSNVSYTYQNNRWRKYLSSIYKSKNRDLRFYYGEYLCREWNNAHSGPEQLETFKIYFMEESTPHPEQSLVVKNQLIWSQDCSTDTKHITVP